MEMWREPATPCAAELTRCGAAACWLTASDLTPRNVSCLLGVVLAVGTSKVETVAEGRLAEVASETARADAFRTLADRHLDASYRLAHVILGQRAEAEDASHDAFVTAWRNWSSLRDPELFEHWFDRILVNTCRNRLRHSSRPRSASGVCHHTNCS
jgi:hypothetical protein